MRKNYTMKVGDIVRVIGVPPDLPEDDEVMQTSTLFLKCVGHEFPIMELADGFVVLDVGEVLGGESFEDTIWIESKYVVAVNPSDEGFNYTDASVYALWLYDPAGNVVRIPVPDEAANAIMKLLPKEDQATIDGGMSTLEPWKVTLQAFIRR